MISFAGSDPSPSTTKIKRLGSAVMRIAGSSPMPLARQARSQRSAHRAVGEFSFYNLDFLALHCKDIAGAFLYAHSAGIADIADRNDRVVLIPADECRLPFGVFPPRVEDGFCFEDQFLPLREFHDRDILIHRRRAGSCGMRSLEVTVRGPSTLRV